jgi:hypothetical protein
MVKDNEEKRQNQVETLRNDLQNLKFYFNEEKRQLDRRLAELVIENEKLKK